MCYKEKQTFFGFYSVGDFLTSLFGLTHPFINALSGLVLVLTSFITGWIYEEPASVYTLWALMFADWGTGIYKSFKLKTFTSSRLFRMPLYFVSTTFVLAISWHIGQAQYIFQVVPSFVLGGFYSVYLISLIENLGELNLLPKRLVSALKNRFGFKAFLDKMDKGQ
jgi:phage-related holin